MVRTVSTMPELGTPARDFSLFATDGREVRLADFAASPALLVIFMCNHCPYVRHIADQLAGFAHEYQPRGLGVVGINSNDADHYPDDGFEQMKQEAAARGYPFPYLYDADQSVAKAYRAACTPDFFLYDASRRLVYRGQFDDSRPGNDVPVTGADMRAAVDAVLAGGAPATEQRPGMGCNIKWKPGNEPDYFG